MKIAHLDCATGIAGDMTLAALLDAGVDEAAVRAAVDSLGLPGVTLHVEQVVKFGFRATQVRVEHPEQHAHRHLGDIEQILAGSSLTDSQKGLALRLFHAVASAEARVHGSTPEKVHFHEVGAVDSIVDVVGVAVGFDLLGADRVTASAIPTGRGRITIDHGVCPVPAPGTAELLKGIPLEDVPVNAELTTPTGAAVVKVLADGFGALPPMTVHEVGYGAGTMDLPDRANLLRLFVGTAADDPAADRVYLVETNLDDETGEVLGFVKKRLFDAGAVDVFSTAVQMKKDRPGVTLSAIVPPGKVDAVEAVLFDQTGTFGVRRHLVERTKRLRREETVDTAFGPVRGKVGPRPAGGEVFAPEFESCAAVSDAKGVPLRDVYRAAEAAFGAGAKPSRSAEPVGHTHDHDHSAPGHSHDHS